MSEAYIDQGLINKFESSLNIQTTLERFDAKGLRLLTPEDSDAISANLSHALLLGREGTQEQGLSITDSLISRVDYQALHEGDKVIEVVIGGTRKRYAIVEIATGNVPQISRDRTGKASWYKEDPIHEKKHANPEDFFNSILQDLPQFLSQIDQDQINGIGIIYSFAGNAVHGAHGLDIQPEAVMGKEFEVPGIEHILVGEAIFNTPALQRFGHVIRRAVVNDMPPVCVAGDAKIGAILATGLNIGVFVDGHYYTTEVGHFTGLPRHEYAELVDIGSSNVGHGLTEKQTSGQYLGPTFGYALNDLQQQGIIPATVYLPPPSEWLSEQVSSLVNGVPWYGVEAKNYAIFRAVAERITFRAAQIFGTLVGTTIHTFAHEFPEGEIRIPVEGALLWRINHFKDIAQIYASAYARRRVEFMDLDQPGIKGLCPIVLSSSEPGKLVA